MVIRVYWASVTSNRKIEGDQARLRNLIESKNIESKWIDITQSRSVMDRMRAECSNSKALPPQIFNDDVHLGDVDDMNHSVEEGRFLEWLQLESGSEQSSLEPTRNGNGQYSANEEQTKSNEVDNKPADFPPPPEIITQTSVSTAVHNFENPEISPKISRKTIELQSTNVGDEKANDLTKKADEERRRRILGLPPMEECGENGANEQHTNNGQPESVSKGRSLFEVENAA